MPAPPSAAPPRCSPRSPCWPTTSPAGPACPADNQELTQAIERAARAVSRFSAEMAGKLATAFRHEAEASSMAAAPPPDPLGALSPREREIVDLIARGDSNKQIARELGIAETTVKIHVQHLLRKLDLDSRVQAAVLVTQQRA